MTTGRPSLRWIAILGRLAAAAALAWVVLPTVDPIKVRDLLFSSRLDKNASLRAITDPPDARLRASISQDQARARAIAADVFGEAVVEQLNALPTTQRLVAMVELLPGLGGHGCGTVSDIGEKAAILRDNARYGCCSDFNEVFLLLALATGTAARELNTSLHTFAEVWLPESKAWMLVDAQFGLVVHAPGSRSGYMSAWDVRQTILRTGSVDFVRLPKRDANAAQRERLIRSYYLDRESWWTLRIVQRSDVVSQSQFLTAAVRHAKRLVQFVAHMLRVLPQQDELQDPA